MFRLTTLFRGVSPFMLFVKKHGANPKLDGLQVADRGRTLGKWYRNLDPEAKAALLKEAANTTPAPRKSKKVALRKQRASTENFTMDVETPAKAIAKRASKVVKSQKRKSASALPDMPALSAPAPKKAPTKKTTDSLENMFNNFEDL